MGSRKKPKFNTRNHSWHRLRSSYSGKQKIIRGATGCAGEIWLSPYKEGMIEDYVSGTGISNLYQRITKRKISGEEISKLAREGDINALKHGKSLPRH